MSMPLYPFSGIIECGKCHCKFKHKNSKYQEHWICYTFDQKGKDFCNIPTIRDEILREKSCEVLNLKEFNEKSLKKKLIILLC